MANPVRNPNKPADKRTVRTKKLLRQALVELIRERGLDAITVSDLTARAEINRGTFYLHYKDVFDLVEHLETELLTGLEKIAGEFDLTELIRHARKDIAYPRLLTLFEYWNANSDFAGAMLGSQGDPSFARRVKELIKTNIYNKVSGTFPAAPGRADTVPRDYLLAFMTSAHIGIIQHWFECGRQQSPADMALILTRLVSQGPVVAFGLLPDSSKA